MSNTSIPQTTRGRKALVLAASGAVSPNGAKGQYYVQSPSGNGRYLAATRATFGPNGRCNCLDFQKRGGPCKHVLAAELYERAQAKVVALCDRHDLTVAQLEARITADLVGGVPGEEIANRLLVLLVACRTLEPCRVCGQSARSDRGICPDCLAEENTRWADYRAEREQAYRPV